MIKKHIKIWIAVGMSAAFLFSMIGCRNKSEEEPVAVEDTPAPTEAVKEPEATPIEEDSIVHIPTEIIETPVPTDVSTEAPVETSAPTETIEPTATPEPGATPIPTRLPMEGDVSVGRFPDYDTGTNAEWSYQSDELRIAIDRVENEEDQIVCYIADIWIRNINSFRIGIGNGKFDTGREDPGHFANRECAIFGISGTMNTGLVIHNGEVLKRGIDKTKMPFRNGIIIVYRDGFVKTIDRAKGQEYNYKKENELHGGVLHALQFGPILVQDGKIPTGLRKNERHPRIIFGYCEPGHYIAVAVDGRTKKSIGMTETEMAELMLSLGCTDAMNLDGGNSAVMLFMGQIINIPSGKDKDGDGIAGRNIVDLLEFAEYDAEGNATPLSEIPADRLRAE